MQLTTVGIVGDGAAAAASAKLFGAFGGTVLSACPEQLKGSEPSNELGEQLELSELLARANIIAVHVDPTSRSKSFVDADFLARMQPRSMLLVSNTALVDMPAALSALQAKSLSHFGAIKGAVAEEVASGFLAMPNALLPPALNLAPTYPTHGAPKTSEWAQPTVSAGAQLDDASPPVRVAFFSSRSYFTERFAHSATEHAAAGDDTLPPLRYEMHESRLDASSAHLASGCKAVCLFVNDDGSEAVLRELKNLGVELILMRCAGFDKINLAVAAEVGLKVVRVPAYSPDAVAQQAVSLLFSLKWQLAKVPGSAPVSDAPLGLNLKGTTVGVLGTGRIGYLFAMIMQKLGCEVIAYDPYRNAAIEAAGIPYLTVEEIYARADVISLHVPLLPTTEHMINEEVVSQKLRPGAILLNVSRGGLIDTEAVVKGLAAGQLGGYGSDVYEYEAPYFFDDHSKDDAKDALLSSLLACPTAQITGHQAFLTNEALSQIVLTTTTNLHQFLRGEELKNQVKA